MQDKNYSLYHKIDNHTDENLLQAFLNQVEGDWVATEKEKGSELKYGKRTDLLSPISVFFGFQTILQAHEVKIQKLLQILDCERVTVYGELFGGAYPHNDVKLNEKVKFVQKPLPAYSPNLEFYAFDIRTEKGLLDFDRCVDLFEKCELFHAKELCRGSLKEMLKFEVEGFETTIPERLGLPKIKKNFAEGVVIKSVKIQYVKGSRAIVKKKSIAFSESVGMSKEAIEKKKLQKLQRDKAIQKEWGEKSEECKNLMIVIKGYVTENRLKGVISKVGQVKIEDLPKLIGLLAKDALGDFEKDFNKEFHGLKEDEKKDVTRKLADVSGKMVNHCANRIVKGDF